MVVVSSGIPVPVLLGTDIYGLKPVMVTTGAQAKDITALLLVEMEVDQNQLKTMRSYQDALRRMKSYQILRVSAML